MIPRVLIAAVLLLAGCASDAPVESPAPVEVQQAAAALREKLAIGSAMEEAKAQAEAQGMLCYWGAHVNIPIAPQSLLLCSRSCDDSRRHGWWVTLAAGKDGKLATIEEAPMRSFAPRSCVAEVKVMSASRARAAVEELASRYSRESGSVVTVEFDADAEVRRRIDEGEAFDVAILDAPMLDALIQSGKVAPDSRTVIGPGGIGAGTAAHAREPEAARQLLKFLTAPEAAEVLKAKAVEPSTK